MVDAEAMLDGSMVAGEYGSMVEQSRGSANGEVDACTTPDTDSTSDGWPLNRSRVWSLNSGSQLGSFRSKLQS